MVRPFTLALIRTALHMTPPPPPCGDVGHAWKVALVLDWRGAEDTVGRATYLVVTKDGEKIWTVLLTSKHGLSKEYGLECKNSH